MDIQLGVFQDKHPAKYLDLIGEKVQAKSIQDRETWDKDKRKKYKKLCKSEGCGRHAWTGSRSGHCYKHADPSTKMCSKKIDPLVGLTREKTTMGISSPSSS